MSEKVIVLNGGGFDSTLLLNYVVDKLEPNNKVVSLFFNYGQRNLEWERTCAFHNHVNNEGVNHFKEIVIPEFNWSDSSLYSDEKKDQYIEMRNMVFLSYAISLAEAIGVKKIYVAFIKHEDFFSDTSPEFLEDMNVISKKRGIEIIAPFHDYYKFDLGGLMNVYNIHEEDFFSCNTPVDGKPCGECADCLAIKEIIEYYSQNNTPQESYVNHGLIFTENAEELYLTTKINTAKLIINNDCQLNCGHCLYSFKGKGDPLTKAEWLNALYQLYELGVRNFDFIGKEPLFNWNIFFYLEYLSKFSNVKSTIVTNGLNLSTYRNELLKFKPKISISLEGLSVNVYRSNYNKSNILNEAINLKYSGLDIELGLDLHKSSLENLYSMLCVLHITDGFNDFYIKTLEPMGDNSDNVLDHTLDQGNLLSVVDILEKFCTENKRVNITLQLRPHHIKMLRGTDLLEEIIFHVDVLKTNTFRGLFNLEIEWFCEKFLDTITVTYDGYVLGCGAEVSLKGYSYEGNSIRSSSLDEIVKEGKERRVEKQWEGCNLIKKYW